MKIRKFKILSIKLSPGVPEPDRLYEVFYSGIIDKKHVENKLFIVAKNI